MLIRPLQAELCTLDTKSAPKVHPGRKGLIQQTKFEPKNSAPLWTKPLHFCRKKGVLNTQKECWKHGLGLDQNSSKRSNPLAQSGLVSFDAYSMFRLSIRLANPPYSFFFRLFVGFVACPKCCIISILFNMLKMNYPFICFWMYFMNALLDHRPIIMITKMGTLPKVHCHCCSGSDGVISHLVLLN